MQSEEGKDGRPTINDVIKDDDGVAPHEAALYSYLGDEAESFIRPKIDGETKATHMYREKTSTTFKSATSGRTDVDSLWSSMREDSNLRLMLKDIRKAKRLRDAYATYARDCIARRVTPITRMNENDDDTYDDFIELLQLRKAELRLKSRRNKEVMFRQSHHNEDTFQVLTHHNPLPDFVNLSGEESVDRFLIPQLDNHVNIDDNDCFKFTSKYDALDCASKHSSLNSESPPYLKRDLDEFGERKRHGNYFDMPYRLMNKKETDRLSGGFKTRMSEEFGHTSDPMIIMLKKLESRNKIRGRLDASTVSLPPLSGGRFTSSRKSTGLSAPHPSINRTATSALHPHAVKWQPLNMSALLDYSGSRKSVFHPKEVSSSYPAPRFGRVPLWRIDEAVTSKT